ncbi:zinc finger CCHC domain-containing protein 2-like [Saccostrea echinata]|uniref:zinc finger CCHC domain-containing protein 2-like n=1 Tax=Saccostrea echinata TaxID=191078 RepID=UPI002A82BCA7|nr:zinc finger CCHC domain-containing protein 2-like [Saccostrea echinata]
MFIDDCIFPQGKVYSVPYNMVGKDLDELYLEFGTLSPHQRIDIVCGMLEMCLGPELRFIGSVVEDLCKKDYIYLREQENKANKPEELESLKQNSTDIRNLQHAMAMNLALLHTDNTHCASIVFDILENNLKRAFSVTPSTEKDSVDIILLVLSMAVRHPAFSFHQRTKLCNYYVCVKQQLESVLCKVDHESRPENPSEPRGKQEADHICNLDVVKADKSHRHERRREYRIQVTWQDNKKTEVLKTYQDFKEFHSKLVKQFPEEANLPKQDRKLPFFSGSPGTGVSKEDEQTIAQYTKLLLQMPKTILSSELVVNFFKGDGVPKSLTAKSSTPVNNIPVSSESDVIPYQSAQVFNTHSHSPPATQPMETLAPYPSNYIITQRPPPVSPSHSPQLISRSPLSDSRSNSPEEQEVTSLMNKVNISQNCSEKAPPIKNWSCEETESLSLTPEQAAKIRANLALNKDKVNNGYIDHLVVTSGGQQIPPGWNPTMIQPPFQGMPHHPVHVLAPHQYVLPASQTSTRDSSPTGSDYSSPLPSPLLKKKTLTTKETDSSSEDNEKEKSHRNGSPHVRKLNKTASGDGYYQDGYDVGGLATLTGGGYQSDPSPSGYYPVINMPPRTLKAQPAHTSKTIPPNNIISMPLDSLYGKRGQVIPLGMAPPIPRTEAPTITSTSNVTSVTSNLDNIGKPRISVYSYPQLRPVAAPRTFVCSVTNSTSVTMSNSITSPMAINGLKSQMTHSFSESSINNPHALEQTIPPLPTQPQSTPTSTPNMQLPPSSTHSTCSNCGCPGHSGNPSYPYAHFIPSHMFHGQHLWPLSALPMTPSSNGLISPHFIPPAYHHFQHFPNLNGLTPQEYLLNNHHQNFVHNPGPPLSGPTNNVPGPIINQGLQRSNSIKERKEKPRVVTCYNCGSHDHIGNDCSESSMESILGHYHLNYEPKE